MSKTALTFLIVLAIILIFPSVIPAQDELSEALPSPRLISETPLANGETRSLSIDLLLNEIANNPGSKGLILLYCGKNCKIGEIEAHLRGIFLTIKRKGIDPDSIEYRPGGYREEFQVEYWIVPVGAEYPRPRSTVSIRDVELKEVFKGKVVAYDCCLLDWTWPPQPERLSEIPLRIRNFLESAPKFEVAMQTREKNGKLVPALGRKLVPNLRKTVSDDKVRDKILKAFYTAAKTEVMGSACYLPSHSIEATDGDRRVHIEICFACRRYTITGSFGEFIGTFRRDEKAGEIFNDFMLGDQN